MGSVGHTFYPVNSAPPSFSLADLQGIGGDVYFKNFYIFFFKIRVLNLSRVWSLQDMHVLHPRAIISQAHAEITREHAPCGFMGHMLSHSRGDSVSLCSYNILQKRKTGPNSC